MVNAFHDAKEKARKKRQILATDRFGLSDLDNAVELPARHSAARASTAAVLVDSSAMSGFKEHIQGVRADVCLLYTSPSPRDQRGSRMPSSA